MSFNVGSQQAGVINNVQGDQTIHGGQQVIVTRDDAIDAIHRLRAELTAEPIDSDLSASALAEVDAMEREATEPNPDKQRIGDRLTRLTEILQSAGTILTTGTALGVGIHQLAGWLGSFGAGAIRVLSR